MAKNLSHRATEAYTGPSMFNASKPPASRYSGECWRQSRALWATDLSNNATNETNASKPATLGYTGELWRQGVGHVLLSKSAHGGWCSTVLEIKLTVVRQVRPPEEGAVRRPSFLVVLGGVLSYMVSAPPQHPTVLRIGAGRGPHLNTWKTIMSGPSKTL